MKNEVASLMNNEELWYFLRKFYKIVRFADTIIIHSSLFIFHYSFIFLQQLQSDKFQFIYPYITPQRRKRGVFMAAGNQELTPMQRQYRALKEKNKDSVLFFRLGDFYEMFNEDATLAARELDLTLTTRDRGKPK